jgi:hypothetical protein
MNDFLALIYLWSEHRMMDHITQFAPKTNSEVPVEAAERIQDGLPQTGEPVEDTD